LKKKLKKTPENWKTSQAHGLADLMYWVWLYYWKQSMTQSNAHQNSNVIFVEIELPVLKLIWKNERPQVTKAILSKIEKYCRYHNTGLQIILQSNSNKHSRVLAQKKRENKWNRIENPEIIPLNYRHLNFDKGVKNIHWRKDSFFIKWCWKTGYLHAEDRN
jgi:hypothetical protein